MTDETTEDPAAEFLYDEHLRERVRDMLREASTELKIEFARTFEVPISWVESWAGEKARPHPRIIQQVVDYLEERSAAIRYLAKLNGTTLQTISDAIDEFQRKIASAYALPAHILDPNAPAPCTALVVTPKCYACGDPLDWIPATQPALCGKCENVP